MGSEQYRYSFGLCLDLCLDLQRGKTFVLVTSLWRYYKNYFHRNNHGSYYRMAGTKVLFINNWNLTLYRNQKEIKVKEVEIMRQGKSVIVASFISIHIQFNGLQWFNSRIMNWLLYSIVGATILRLVSFLCFDYYFTCFVCEMHTFFFIVLII